MCGIFAILDHSDADSARALALTQAPLLRHRGPDWSGLYVDEQVALAHERLAIVDPASGAQPLTSPDGALVLAVNGEIYDHQVLRQRSPAYDFQTASDCEVLLARYRDVGEAMLGELRGMFAFVLWDRAAGTWMIARDPNGIIPLYWGCDAEGRTLVASELKALVGHVERVHSFPPGHVMTSEDTAPRRWYHRVWHRAASEPLPTRVGHPDGLRQALADSVRAHLMCDVPYGVLLSGGLDSSVVAALAARFARGRVESGGSEEAWYPRLHTFSIGLRGSPDLAAAQEVADALGTVHHGFTFTVQEGLDALSEVIRHLETFDVTTVRASTPMWLMARRIRALGVKMVLSGEGSDELFGGYLYFHKAPDDRAFHEETARKLGDLHLYDCLRANKSMAAWGVECRVPFLDTRFVDYAMSIDPSAKRCGGGRIEKELLRRAFEGWLPQRVLWRQKEQFSDGVGYGWIDALRDFAEQRVSDAELAGAAERFPSGTPRTKEAYLYRALFESHYPSADAVATVPVQDSIACSSPVALAWDASFRASADPSGRAVAGVHGESWSPDQAEVHAKIG
ncbi:MAG: asparagine synthase B [Deltaproteobacteria bacterium]|nr:MAG: asparagine synthase B [Deltaproteobacteria bacterium]